MLGLNGKSIVGDSNMENMTKNLGKTWLLDSSEIIDVSMRRVGSERSSTSHVSFSGWSSLCVYWQAPNNFSVLLCQSRTTGFMLIFWLFYEALVSGSVKKLQMIHA